MPILNMFTYLCIFAVPWFYVYILSLNKNQLHFSSFQCILSAFNAVITPSLTVWILGSKAILKFSIIYSSCYMTQVSVMKFLQLAYCNWIYVGLLLHPFMVVNSSLKWTKLHSSYHLFLKLRIPYLGKLHQGKVTKFWTSDKNFPDKISKKC